MIACFKVDDHIWQKFKAICGDSGASAILRTLIEHYIGESEKDIEFYKSKLQRIEENKQRIEAEETALRKRIEEQEVIQEKKVKEMEAKSKNCINCGTDLTDKIKSVTFKRGKVCRACYLKSDKQQFDKWNNESSG